MDDGGPCENTPGLVAAKRQSPGPPGVSPRYQTPNIALLPGLPLVYTGEREPGSPEQGCKTLLTSPKWRLQRIARQLLPGEKNLHKCHATPRASQVEVHRSALRSTASYRGLCTCRSVWQCPVCSARIAATRAEELTGAIERHRNAGGTVALLTHTASHTRQETLSDLVDGHRRAHLWFWRQRATREALAAAGHIGRVSAFEVTFGLGSGWHPHRHVLLFLDRQDGPDALEALEASLAPLWVAACHRGGLTASVERGLDLRGGEAAGSYVAKLGLEVALAVRKLGRGSDRHGVWQLLEALACGNAWAGHAFAEYAVCMKGRRHLMWSPGLKKALAVDEVTDDEIMEAGGDQDEALFATLTNQLWAGVHRNELRGELLHLLGLDQLHEARALLSAFGLDPGGLTSNFTDDIIIEEQQ